MHNKPDLLRRCLQLAMLGLGNVSSTPLQGWLLVNDQTKVLAEGWLPGFPILSNSSGPGNFFPQTSGAYTLILNQLMHASPELITRLRQCSVSHILIAASVTDDLKSKLRKTDITIEDAQLADHESFLNRRFYTFQTKQRPYIILKWAQTADGFVARKNYDSKWISNSLSRRLVHKWRAEEDAIMVGTNTAHYDNPRLNVRNWSGRDPLRIVIDNQLRLDSNLLMFDNSQPTVCYNQQADRQEGVNEWVRISEEEPLAFFKAILHDLYQRKIQSLIVEGGSQLLQFLTENQLWDEARVFTADVFFKEGIAAPNLTGANQISTTSIDGDQLRIYQKLNRK